MNLRGIVRRFTVCSVVLWPAWAWAQSATTGSIAGVVRDTTGAVLPGVTVEAASPALIEKVRIAVSDDSGNYKILDLRPGTYVVTFTLPGFSTFRREGLELTTGFTATVNAELRVGALEETVTVTGASPVVDVQNVQQQRIFKKDAQEALPLGRNLAQWATMVPGATMSQGGQGYDVGGTAPRSIYLGMRGVPAGNSMGLYQDGMSFKNEGAGSGLLVNTAAIEEVALQTSGFSAESPHGTVQVNLVPREGGNTFKLLTIGTYSNGDLQSDNLTEELVARGATGGGDLKFVRQFNVGLGGPLKRDRLWFYTAHLWSGNSRYQPGNYYNATQDSWLYTPDLSRPAASDDGERDHQLRLTWQVAPKHKVNAHLNLPFSCQCRFLQGTEAPEASYVIDFYAPLTQVSWSHPATSRLLFEAGGTVLLHSSVKRPQPEATRETIAVVESSRNYRYRSGANSFSMSGAFGDDQSNQVNERVGVSYITGSHAFKVGLTMQQGWTVDVTEIPQDIAYTFRNGVPLSVTVFATPAVTKERARQVALFVQDQWTVSRWTLNLGARFDYYRGFVPDQHLSAGTYVPARDFAGVNNVPNWKDITPRIGFAYDLFGNGKTALKGLIGRYVDFANIGNVVAPNNPVATLVTSATRTWNDANGDYVPQESELGPLSNANFGKSIVTTRRAEDIVVGWGTRPDNWQMSAQIQHELRPGMGVNVGYFRTSFGNFTATDNLAVTPADFDPYCITAPRDPRLLGGGGEQVCGLYDIAPAKFGQVSNLVTQVSNFGRQTRVYNGVDATVDIRFRNGGSISGGVSTGATVTDNCEAIVDSPEKRFCRDTPPWSAGTQLRLGLIHPFVWGLRASAVVQNLPGIPITASYIATNAEIRPSLGRNLGQCRGAAVCNGTTTVELIEPNTLFEDRITQVDLRLTRLFRLGRARVQGNLDVMNLFNASSVTGINTRYGPSWLQPTYVLGGRLFRIGFQLDM